MLTVKHIQMDGIQDSESVFEADTVEFIKTPAHPKGEIKIWCPRSSTKDGHIEVEAVLYAGTVYVMNDNGKTVANYCLEQLKSK